MDIFEMKVEEVEQVLPLYIDYYNNYEGSCWTDETAGRRIRQVLRMDDSYALIMKDDETPVGFVMGYFKQYDDIVGYTLEEIIISSSYRQKGLGTILLKELEDRVRERGASCIELEAVNDEMHHKYYAKAGFLNADNFVMKVKWFD